MKINKPPSISVVAICKNEERDLPSFLEHLYGWVDEIVVVDDDSTDGTKAILARSGQKVNHIITKMEPGSGYAGLRNKGIEVASSDWLLHMDIDERVPDEFKDEILDSISKKNHDAYRYRRMNFFLHRPMKGCGFQDWNKPQLARRGIHHFDNAVHEVCVIDTPVHKIGQLNGKMWHLNDENYLERLAKSFIYCQNQSSRLKARGYTIRWYHLFSLPLFEFGRKYVYRKGFRDGILGLIFALHSASAMFKAAVLLWDEQNRIERDTLEKSIN